MADPKQPKFVPVIAGDLDESSTYDAPSELYDGVLSFAMPNAGTYSAGLTPDQSWFGAQSFNALMQSYGMHLDALADLAGFDVDSMPAHFGGDRLDFSDVAGTGKNANGTSDPPLIFPSADGYLLVQLAHQNTNVGDAILEKWHPTQGYELLSSSDTTAWQSGVGAGASGAESNKAPLIASDPDSANCIACATTRTVWKSSNRGGSWSAATALPANANWQYPTAALDWGSKWAVVDYCPTTTYVSRLLLSNDLNASAAWTTVTGNPCGGNDGGTVRRIIRNTGTIVMLPDHNTTIAIYSTGDSSVTNIQLTGAADSTRTGWRGAWNPQIEMFLIGNVQGDLWTSPDGTTWTQVGTNVASLSVKDVIAHGRGFVVSNGSGGQFLDFYAFGRDQVLFKRRIGQGLDQTQTGYFHLVQLRGRWVAARVIAYSVGGLNLRYGLEWYRSAVNPWDRNNFAGR